MACCGGKKKLEKKIEEIVIGWKNYIFPSDKIEQIAKLRVPICATCIHKEYIFKKSRRVPYCELCKCPIHAKVRNPDSVCPADPPKWKRS